eukprot:gene10738-10894_t
MSPHLQPQQYNFRGPRDGRDLHDERRDRQYSPYEARRDREQYGHQLADRGHERDRDRSQREYAAGRVPPHVEWNADLGMFKAADGSWHLVRYDHKEQVAAQLPQEVLQESDRNIGQVQGHVRSKLQLLARAVNFPPEQMHSNPLEFMRTLVTNVHPFYFPVEDPEDPTEEWEVGGAATAAGGAGAAGAGASRLHGGSGSGMRGLLHEIRAWAAEGGRVRWGVTITRCCDGLPLPLRQEPYLAAELLWAGAAHMMDFLVATRQVEPLLPPSSSAKAVESAVAAATAAVPSLVLPVQLLLRQRCDDEAAHVEGKFLEVAEGSKLAERMVIQLPGLDAGSEAGVGPPAQADASATGVAAAAGSAAAEELVPEDEQGLKLWVHQAADLAVQGLELMWQQRMAAASPFRDHNQQLLTFGPPPPLPVVALANAAVVERGRHRLTKLVREIVADLLPLREKPAQPTPVKKDMPQLLKLADAQLLLQWQQGTQGELIAAGMADHQARRVLSDIIVEPDDQQYQ